MSQSLHDRKKTPPQISRKKITKNPVFFCTAHLAAGSFSQTQDPNAVSKIFKTIL